MYNITEFEQSIESAKQSKQSFIKFINDIEITQVEPWVFGWLDQFWSDEKSRVFFDSYWHGSLDAMTVIMEYGELPSILDDIETCMIEQRLH